MKSSKIYEIGSYHLCIKFDTEGFWFTDKKDVKNKLYFWIGTSISEDNIKVFNFVVGPIHIGVG